MFCTKCGLELRDKDKYCFDCGTPTPNVFTFARCGVDRLSRPLQDRKIAGVCAGVARYLGIDVTAIRIIALVLLFWPVPLMGSIAYLIAWIVMPQDPLGLPAPSAVTLAPPTQP